MKQYLRSAPWSILPYLLHHECGDARRRATFGVNPSITTTQTRNEAYEAKNQYFHCGNVNSWVATQLQKRLDPVFP